MVDIVFMGTPDFAVPVLKKLFETQRVVGVVTQPDRPAGRGRQVQPPPVKAAAEAMGIPVYQPRSLRSEEAAEPLREW
jgi:methionyl-tRNA formyltransferase